MTSPFDPGRDEVLGRLLRDALEPSHPGAFMTRVAAVIRADARETIWDILAGWARTGVAAAAAIALALAIWLARSEFTERSVVTLADAVETSVPTLLLSGGADAGTDAVLAAMVGDR
jgi:anti-sigma-K factor RskA